MKIAIIGHKRIPSNEGGDRERSGTALFTNGRKRSSGYCL